MSLSNVEVSVVVKKTRVTVTNLLTRSTLDDEFQTNSVPCSKWNATKRIGIIRWNAALTLKIEDPSSYSADEQNFTGTISNPFSALPTCLSWHFKRFFSWLHSGSQFISCPVGGR